MFYLTIRTVEPPRVAVVSLSLIKGAALMIQVNRPMTLGALVVGVTVRACRRGSDASALEQRVSRIEDLLGMTDAGASATGTPVAPSAAQAPVSLDDHSAACAVAKVAAYRVWQEAVARAKANAAPAEAACADIWTDTKKQACYRNAMAQIRGIAHEMAGGANQPCVFSEDHRAVRGEAIDDAIRRGKPTDADWFVGALADCLEHVRQVGRECTES